MPEHQWIGCESQELCIGDERFHLSPTNLDVICGRRHDFDKINLVIIIFVLLCSQFAIQGHFDIIVYSYTIKDVVYTLG